MNINKEIMITGAGAGVGVIWTVLSKSYIDKNFGMIPYLGSALPAPWGYWSTGGSIMIGGVILALSYFTNFFKHWALKGFLHYFGITTLIGGIANGIFYNSAPAARAGGLKLRTVPRTAGPVSQMTPTGIPAAKVLA